MKKLILTLFAFVNFSSANDTEKVGDIVQIVVPAYAYALSAYNDDMGGGRTAHTSLTLYTSNY
ncbi:hypothetical protein [Campylobacter gastrosuis]|uniref:Adhesin n=1 Tax=Campylobacter gastrosuis TaxID=2974576 RepID=A0ABT7HS62_9BACT|nr:hypothetical protein [Campylobacter gastrosuis]MDL0089664.1 hypothetical protein [Campylobacter gastrosuis]